MIPASVAGITFLASLIPGFIFLKLTNRHRQANHNPSAFEEAIILVAVGLSIFGPVVLATALLFPGQLACTLRVLASPSAITASDVRMTAVFVTTELGIACVAAVIAALWYRHNNPIRSGESTWSDVFGAHPGTALKVVTVTHKDGTVVQGVLYSYDGIAMGDGRDIALQPPLSVFRDGQPKRPLKTDRLVISEKGIHSITVDYDHLP